MAVSVAAALLLVAVFAGDSVWTASPSLLVAGSWGALALAGRAPLPGGGGVLVGLLLATAAWSGLSIAWSVAPDLSWAELNRTLVYAAFLAVGLLLGAAGQPAMPLRLAALADRGVRRRRRLGPRGQSDPGALPRRRPRRPAARPDRLLERARARRRRAARARTLASPRSARAGCRSAWAVRRSPTRRSSQSFSRPRAPGSRRRCSAIVLWLWLRRDRVEAALLALVAIVPAAARRRLGVHPAGARRGRQPRTRTASPTAPGSGCSSSPGAALVALGARELARRPLPPARRRQAAAFLRGLAFAVAFVDGRRPRCQRRPDRGRVPRRGGAERPGPVREPELEQPARLVGRGARTSSRPHPLAGAGANTFEVARKRYRELASSVTPAAQRPAPVPGRDRARRARRFCSGSSRPPRQRPSAPCDASRGSERDAGGGARRRARALARPRARRLRLGLRRGHRPGASSPPAPSPQPDGRRVRGTFPVAAAAAAALALASVGRDRHALARGAERARRRSRARAGRDRAGPRCRASERGRSTRSRSRRSSPRARVEEDAGDEDAALAAYRRAAALQPDNPVVVVRARPVRVPPRRPLLGLRPPEPGVHARPGRPAVGARRRARPGSLAWVNAGNC